MKKICILLASLVSFNGIIQAQKTKFQNYEPQAVSVQMSKVNVMGKIAFRAVKDSTVKSFDEPTFIRLKNVDFKNGTIEVKVLSRLLPNAPEMARGFIGVAFRINDSNTKYESIYVRPVNARVNDQVRRNHSIQYYSYPNYKFDTLRKIAPEKYESYTDMEMNKWIDLRIVVKDAEAKLFINKSEQPSLVVTDLKLGAGVSGAVALWVETGTDGYFSDLKITKQD
jgi:hypothetical protein